MKKEYEVAAMGSPKLPTYHCTLHVDSGTATIEIAESEDLLSLRTPTIKHVLFENTYISGDIILTGYAAGHLEIFVDTTGGRDIVSQQFSILVDLSGIGQFTQIIARRFIDDGVPSQWNAYIYTL